VVEPKKRVRKVKKDVIRVRNVKTVVKAYELDKTRDAFINETLSRNYKNKTYEAELLRGYKKPVNQFTADKIVQRGKHKVKTSAENVPVIKEKIKAPLFAPTKKGKKAASKPKNSFNQQVLNLLYQKVVYNAIDRPVLQGILFEKGSVIATDAHILAIIKMDYPKSNEGKVIDKQGNIIEGKFPNYQSVIPNLFVGYRKIDNPNLILNYTQGKYASDDKYMLYNFRVDKKNIDTVKKIFAKFKETPTLYLHKTATQQPMVFKSKTVYMLVMPMYNG